MFDFTSGSVDDNSDVMGNVTQTVNGLRLTVSSPFDTFSQANDVTVWHTNSYGDLTFSKPVHYIATSNSDVLLVGGMGNTSSVQFSFDVPVNLGRIDLGDGTDSLGSFIRISAINTSDSVLVAVPDQSDIRVALNWTGVTGFIITPQSGTILNPLLIDNIVATRTVFNSAPTGSVAIAGTARQGETLTASNSLADADGMGAVAYQWRADGIDIQGATAATLVLGQAHVGSEITVVARYLDQQGTAEAVASAATARIANINDAPTGGVAITGTATQGQTLAASNTLADIDGMGTVTYQWQADGIDISGATATTLVLGQEHVGKAVTVIGRYTDQHGTAEAPVSAPTAAVANINDQPTGSVTIAGTASEGQALTASNTLADADGMGSVTYQWKAGGVDIPGATGGTFVLTSAQVGMTVTVVARYTDQYHTAESKESAATASVTNVNAAPTGSVAIAGTARQGETLTASNSLADADGMGAVAYQWRADGIDIQGATAATLVLGQAHVGSEITVVARYLDQQGTAEAVASAATARIANINDAPTGDVAITGTATQGHTLAASNTLADIDGMGTVTYQWQADGIDISGATATTLVLGQEHVGKAVTVIASYTDQQGSLEIVSATPTGNVAEVNDAPVLIASGSTAGQYVSGSSNGAALFSNVAVSTVEAGQAISEFTLRASGMKDAGSEVLVIGGMAVALVTGTTVTLDAGRSAEVSFADGAFQVAVRNTAGWSARGAEDLIEGIRYKNTGSAPTLAELRTFEIIRIRDNGGTADGGIDTAAVSIVSTATVVAAPPVVTPPVVTPPVVTPPVVTPPVVTPPVVTPPVVTPPVVTPPVVTPPVVTPPVVAPPVVTPPAGTDVTIDGVKVQTGQVSNPDGSTSQTLTIPVVAPGRAEQIGNNAVADIPLVARADGTALLSAQVPTGLGLSIAGSNQAKTAGNSLADLIREIRAHTEAGSSDQDQLTGGGSGFLSDLLSSTTLLVQTIVPTAAVNAPAGSEALVINGVPAAAGKPMTALVIDAHGLPAGTNIELNDVEFAAVIGDVRVSGGLGSQNVWGDGRSQYIVLGADDDVLHGGAGNDIVGSAGGNDKVHGDEGDDTVFGGTGNNHIDGGSGHDVALLEDAHRGDYTWRIVGGNLTMTHVGSTGDTDTIANVETLRFTEAEADLSIRGTVDRLVEAVTGQAGGFTVTEHWIDAHAGGTSVLDIAQALLGLDAAQDAMSNDDFVADLYGNVLHREGDAAGTAFWVESLDTGAASRAAVVLGFAESGEKLALRQPLDVDFNHSEVAALVRMYGALFDRAPDEEGLNFWIGHYEAGATLSSIADHFVASSEYAGRHGDSSNEDFVSALYRSTLQREGDAAGLAFWIDALDTGAADKGDVLLAFAESAENIGLVGAIGTSIDTL